MSEQIESAQVSAGRSEKRHPTKQALLDAAIADMEATGEASIRVLKIVSDAGSTNGSIAYHFGSREGLVQEAIAERYLSAVSQGLAVFTSRIGEVATFEQLEEFFRTELDRLGDSSFHQLRVRRLSALGASLLRPGLRERIVAEQAAYFDRAAVPIMRLQQAGIVDPAVDARAFAAWFLGLLIVRVLSDIDGHGEYGEAWAQFTLRAILVNLKAPASDEHRNSIL